MNTVIKVSDETKKKMIEHYKDKAREKTPPYAIFQAEEFDTVITLYESGKVMFQGTSADVDADMWKEIDGQETNPIKEEEKKYYDTSAIGSDEVGTGDYFGPIVVTAAYVNKKDIKFLEQLKIMDSKKMTDDKIRKVAPDIIKKIKYKSIIINNEEYNEKYNKDTNMNKIKAIMHNKVLTSLKNETKDQIEYIIIDEFCTEKRFYEYLNDTNSLKGLTFLQKGESKNIAVATASVISRYIFLLEFDKLSDTYHIPLPKGSGANVDVIGQELVEKHGKEVLNKIAKKNFSNTSRILKTMII